jgi:hypothetical protein
MSKQRPMFRISIAAALAFGACIAGASRTVAQTAPDTAASAPDKSAYWLFSPTPDGEMRAFCTDRPPKANSPCTVDAGHFQYETDILNWTYARSGGVTTNTWLYTNPTLKLGLTNRIDLELNIAPLETVTTRSPSGKSTLAGVGDLFLRVKVNVAGPEGGDFQAALVPFLKIPTARAGIGDGAVEGGLIVPISLALPHDFTLILDPEVDILRDANGLGKHANFQMLFNVSHALSDSVTAYVELWGQANNDPAFPTKQASLDLSATWLVRPNLQFDAGANIGLTSATPAIQLYLGLSQRF